MNAKLLLVDDNELTRMAIKRLLAHRTEWQICAEAGDGTEAVEKAKTQCPDLAILDIEMPRKNGIQAAKDILQYCPDTIVVSNSIHDVRTVMGQLQQAGVRAFVAKDRLATDLIPTIEVVLSGRTRLHAPKARSA